VSDIIRTFVLFGPKDFSDQPITVLRVLLNHRSESTSKTRALCQSQRNRDWDSYLNQFSQPDTIIPNPANPQSYNRYSYGLNNPLRYTDPSGHVACVGNNFDDGPQCKVNPASSWYYTGISKGKYSSAEQGILEDLIRKGGTTTQHAAKYIVTNSKHLIVHGGLIGRTGAHWTLSGDIAIDPRQGNTVLKSLDEVQQLPNYNYFYVLAVITEEAKHLEQPLAVRLSVYGEHEGWKTKYSALKEFGFNDPPKDSGVSQLLRMPLQDNYEQLDMVWKYMVASQGGFPSGFSYMVWLLPNRPLWGLYKP
jgi:RHS repeat-associated protein